MTTDLIAAAAVIAMKRKATLTTVTCIPIELRESRYGRGYFERYRIIRDAVVWIRFSFVRYGPKGPLRPLGRLRLCCSYKERHGSSHKC